MAIFVKWNDKYYEIPEEVLARSVVSKVRSDAGVRRLGDSITQKTRNLTHYRLIEFSDDDFDEPAEA